MKITESISQGPLTGNFPKSPLSGINQARQEDKKSESIRATSIQQTIPCKILTLTKKPSVQMEKIVTEEI